MNTHPEFKLRTDEGDFKAFIVSKDTRCMDCHSQNELLDYGYLTVENQGELDSLIYKYPYWAGNEEAETISMREYYSLHPTTVTVYVDVPVYLPEPVPEPIPGPPHPPHPGPKPVPFPPQPEDPPTKTRNPVADSPSGESKIRNNSGGRGNDAGNDQSRDGRERGTKTIKTGSR